jgi:hypothetical protein
VCAFGETSQCGAGLLGVPLSATWHLVVPLLVAKISCGSLVVRSSIKLRWNNVNPLGQVMASEASQCIIKPAFPRRDLAQIASPHFLDLCPGLQPDRFEATSSSLRANTTSPRSALRGASAFNNRPLSSQLKYETNPTS